MAYALHCEDGPLAGGGDRFIDVTRDPEPGQRLQMADGSVYVLASRILRGAMTGQGFLDVWRAHVAPDDATAR